MKFTRTLVLITCATLLVTACNKDSDETVAAVSENTNPLLAHVPTDTAYVFANIETAPQDIIDTYVTRFQPVMDVMSDQIRQFQTDYQTGELQDSPLAQLAMAVLDELGGSLSVEGLNNIGISLQAHHAIYATGVFPVIRLGLDDEQRLRDAIARIETKMGTALPLKDLNGTSYWRIAEDQMPVGIYMAILEGQFALSVFPVSAEDGMLAAFLGQEMPSQSMASSNALSIMNNKKAYSPYGSGYLDIQKISSEFLDPESSTRTLLGPELNAKMTYLDDVCVAEIKSMIAKAPRMTSGVTRLTDNELAMRYDLEIENTLANGLAALVSNTPPADTGDHLVSASLALNIGKLRNFLLEKATEIYTSPYQCATLQNLNVQAEQLMNQLNIPMPPMINNLMGLRVRMDDFDPAIDITQADGLLALHVDKPEMFVGMASMMVPGFEELDLANQSEPVKIPAQMLHMQGVDVYALLGKTSIGASIGEQYVNDLEGFMGAKTQDDGTFFSISHDMAKQMEIQEALTAKYQLDVTDNNTAATEYSEAMKKVYADMLGQSRLEMRFTTDGLQIDNNIKFK